MSGVIEHTGTVVEVRRGSVDVRIEVQEACAACQARTLCGVESGSERIVNVNTDFAEAFAEGERVVVQITRGMGLKAAALAYAVPFLLLLAVLLVLLGCGAGETVAGLGSLGAVALYYLLLALLRGRIEKEIIFKLKKL